MTVKVETCKTNCLKNIPTSDSAYGYKDKHVLLVVILAIC